MWTFVSQKDVSHATNNFYYNIFACKELQQQFQNSDRKSERLKYRETGEKKRGTIYSHYPNEMNTRAKGYVKQNLKFRKKEEEEFRVSAKFLILRE